MLYAIFTTPLACRISPLNHHIQLKVILIFATGPTLPMLHFFSSNLSTKKNPTRLVYITVLTGLGLCGADLQDN